MTSVKVWTLTQELVCGCSIPRPRKGGVWGAETCALCDRLVVDRDAASELIERVLATVTP